MMRIAKLIAIVAKMLDTVENTFPQLHCVYCLLKWIMHEHIHNMNNQYEECDGNLQNYHQYRHNTLHYIVPDLKCTVLMVGSIIELVLGTIRD